MSTNNDALIRITGDASGLTRALNQPRDALGRFVSAGRRELRELDSSLDRTERSVNRLTSALTAAARRARSAATGAAGGAGGFLSGALSTASGLLGANAITSALSRAESLAESLGEKIVTASRDPGSPPVVRREAVKETGGALAVAEVQAADFAKSLGLSETAAKQLFATATIGLAGTGAKAGDFLKAAADLAAARGIELKDLGTIITQIFNGADEGLGRLFAGKNPSTFFNEFAKATGRTADSLTDVERRQILVNAVIQAAAGHAGLAGERLGTLAGKYERLLATLTDVAARVGDAIQRNAAFISIVDRAGTALSRLATDQGAVDAAVQKAADSFVTAATRAIDFGASVARGVNVAVGFLKRGQVLAEQTLLSVFVVARDVVDGIQLLVIDMVTDVSSLTRKALGAFEGLVSGISTMLGDALSKVPRGAFAAIPGGEAVLDAARGVQQALSGTGEALRQVEAGFDFSTGAVEKWRERVTESTRQTSQMRGRIDELTKSYAAIDRATEAANKRTDAFFAGLKSGLPDIAKFNPQAAAAPVSVTRVIAEGDTLRSVEELTTAQTAAATDTKTAVTDLKTTVGTLVQTMQEVAGLGRIEGAITGLKTAVEKGALIQITAGLGTTVDELGAGLPLGSSH